MKWKKPSLVDKADVTLLLALVQEMAVSSLDLKETIIKKQSIANNKGKNKDNDKRTLIRTTNSIRVP